MSTVRSADGTTIAYTRAGQGPPLILVDGALCSRSFGPMPKLAEQLAPHFTVYTYDRRGRGASSDTKPYAPDREVEDLEALVAVAGDTVYVHGTSSGAALALEAAKHIRSIARLALYEPPFIVDGSRAPMPEDWLPAGSNSWSPTTGRATRSRCSCGSSAPRPSSPRSCRSRPSGASSRRRRRPFPYDLTILHDHQQGTPLTAGGVGRGQGAGAGRGGRQEPGLDGQRDACARRRPAGCDLPDPARPEPHGQGPRPSPPC